MISLHDTEVRHESQSTRWKYFLEVTDFQCDWEYVITFSTPTRSVRSHHSGVVTKDCLDNVLPKWIAETKIVTSRPV